MMGLGSVSVQQFAVGQERLAKECGLRCEICVVDKDLVGGILELHKYEFTILLYYDVDVDKLSVGGT